MQKVQKDFQKKISKFIEDKKLSVFSISLQKNHLTLTGNKTIIDMVTENPTITLTELMYSMMAQRNTETNDAFTCISSTPGVLPQLPHKFKGCKWSVGVCRSVLTDYMQCLGFYPGSDKTYGKPEHTPAGWPDSLSFEGIKHVSYMKLKDMNLVLESLLQHRNIDILKYHIKYHSEARNLSERKRRRPQQSRSVEVVLDESAEAEIEEAAVQSSSSTDPPP